jgi:hypothetical protein
MTFFDKSIFLRKKLKQSDTKQMDHGLVFISGFYIALERFETHFARLHFFSTKKHMWVHNKKYNKQLAKRIF